MKIIISGDAIEAIAIKSVFSDHATSGALALSSTKVLILESANFILLILSFILLVSLVTTKVLCVFRGQLGIF
jgi:hypothetical protein